MATIWEIDESGAGEDGERKTREIVYLVQIDLATETDATARALVSATRPPYYPGTSLPAATVRLAPVEADVFKATVEYSSQQQDRDKEDFEGSLSYSTIGGTARIYYSRETVGRYGLEGAQGPDYDGAIGVTDNGIEGVDVFVTMPKLTVSIAFPQAYVTTARLDRWELWSNTVNKNDWSFAYNGRTRSYKACETLFLGFQFDEKLAAAQIVAKFDFAIVRTVTNMVVGKGKIGSVQVNGKWVVPEKKGHDYLWARGQRRSDPVTNTTIETPISANVERVYPALYDFGQLWS